MRWTPSFLCTSTSTCEQIFPAPVGATLLADMAYVQFLYGYNYSSGGSSYTTNFRSVASELEGQSLCAQDVFCSGFALSPTSSNLFYFIPFILNNGAGPALPPMGLSNIWLIDRISLYRCSGEIQVNPNYYCANNPGITQTIITFATQTYQSLSSAYIRAIGLENYNPGGNCGDTSSSNSYWTDDIGDIKGIKDD